MIIKNSKELAHNNESNLDRRDENVDDDYLINEVTLEKHNFHTDYDKYKCPDCGNMRMRFVNCGCWEA